VSCVAFDVGETLVSETRHWAAWADWMRIPRLTFFAALGGVIERGEHHRVVFELLRPGFDLQAEIAKRRAAGMLEDFSVDDLYPDALPCLRALCAAGYRVGLVGNQPRTTEAFLAEIGVPVDFIASSEGWGVAKPDLEFFTRVAEVAALPPAEIAYVGDRLDNDVLPARAVGMLAVFIRRGPWGVLHALRPEVSQAHIQLESLAELPDALAALSSAPPVGP
jgi:FMN phosphatase YigB (HAD superfamily)